MGPPLSEQINGGESSKERERANSEKPLLKTGNRNEESGVKVAK